MDAFLGLGNRAVVAHSPDIFSAEDSSEIGERISWFCIDVWTLFGVLRVALLRLPRVVSPRVDRLGTRLAADDVTQFENIKSHIVLSCCPFIERGQGKIGIALPPKRAPCKEYCCRDLPFLHASNITPLDGAVSFNFQPFKLLCNLKYWLIFALPMERCLSG